MAREIRRSIIRFGAGSTHSALPSAHPKNIAICYRDHSTNSGSLAGFRPGNTAGYRQRPAAPVAENQPARGQSGRRRQRARKRRLPEGKERSKVPLAIDLNEFRG